MFFLHLANMSGDEQTNTFGGTLSTPTTKENKSHT